MRLKYLLPLLAALILISCSREEPKIELSNPGFGIIETSINAGTMTTNIPVLIKLDKEIKGIQFTLNWDVAVAKVGEPALTELNSGFTVSTGNSGAGKLKVLIFSMTGDVLDTSVPEILTIPVSILDPAAEEVSLLFEKAVFAGPKARSYEVPITHAKLRIDNS